MELYPLKVFLTVANEKSFSRAAEKLLRTQPAVSLAIQKLESDLQEKLMDRSGKDLILTDAGRIVLEYARRFENLESDLENALAELRDNSAGRLIVGANESTTLYLLEHIEQYRRLYPKVKVQVRRSAVEQDSSATDRRRSRVRNHQLRSRRRSLNRVDNLHRSSGVRSFPATSFRVARRSLNRRIRHGDIHRA